MYLLTYGNGSSLAVDVVQRQIVRSTASPDEVMRIRAIAAIEASQVSMLPPILHVPSHQVVDGGESGGDNDAATKSTLRVMRQRCFLVHCKNVVGRCHNLATSELLVL